MVEDTEMTQERPKLGIDGPALGSVAKACCCGAPQPTGRSGYHTGGKVAVWTGIRPSSSGGSMPLYPLAAIKIGY